jgi:hypothetical protein
MRPAVHFWVLTHCPSPPGPSPPEYLGARGDMAGRSVRKFSFRLDALRPLVLRRLAGVGFDFESATGGVVAFAPQPPANGWHPFGMRCALAAEARGLSGPDFRFEISDFRIGRIATAFGLHPRSSLGGLGCSPELLNWRLPAH